MLKMNKKNLRPAKNPSLEEILDPPLYANFLNKIRQVFTDVGIRMKDSYAFLYLHSNFIDRVIMQQFYELLALANMREA